jgi:hypothetical protein
MHTDLLLHSACFFIFVPNQKNQLGITPLPTPQAGSIQLPSRLPVGDGAQCMSRAMLSAALNSLGNIRTKSLIDMQLEMFLD